MTQPAEVPQRDINWNSAVRIIPSRFPPVNVFESVADPADLEEVFRVEGLTNDRLRDQAGDLRLVRPEDRIAGPGTTPIMAAFTHPSSSRFTDGSFGVYYASRDRETAVDESCYRRELFMRASVIPATDLEMRIYFSDISGSFRDLRGLQATYPHLYDPNNYEASQPFGKAVYSTHEDGICYSSVRHAGGECAAVMRACKVSSCRQGPHLIYRWDGARISSVGELHGR